LFQARLKKKEELKKKYSFDEEFVNLSDKELNEELH
jgi:hypothetical protein